MYMYNYNGNQLFSKKFEVYFIAEINTFPHYTDMHVSVVLLYLLCL